MVVAEEVDATLATLGSTRFRDDRDKEKRRVKIYDAENDALDIVEAMGQKPIDADVIIDILPALSHDQMLELRAEYKRHCKSKAAASTLPNTSSSKLRATLARSRM